MSDPNEVTLLLDAWSAGRTEALEELLPLVFDDLRHLARRHLARERLGHSLEPTALVHEVYLRLAGLRTVRWESPGQFFGAMAEIMRRVLVDHARRKRAAKKGSGLTLQSFDETMAAQSLWGPTIRGFDIDLVALDDALRSLAAVDTRQARVVELRFFGSLTIEETARALGISPMTVKREWHTARLWLLRQLAPPRT